jgi:hypothetical protein
MKKLENSELKQAICVDMAQKSKPKVMRYVIENLTDLNKFFKHFKEFDILNTKNNLSKSIKEGSVILLTDPHFLTGVNTYCYENIKGLIRENIYFPLS